MYGFRDAYVKMVNKEQTWFFHLTQSFDKHKKQLIAPEL
jgi:hypothetical protein